MRAMLPGTKCDSLRLVVFLTVSFVIKNVHYVHTTSLAILLERQHLLCFLFVLFRYTAQCPLSTVKIFSDLVE